MIKTYVGLDIAETMGVAVWQPEIQRATVYEVKGNPVVQLIELGEQILIPLGEEDKPLIAIELLTYLRNAKTTRSILERTGFLRHNLLNFGYTVEDVNLNTARRYLGTKSKFDTQEKFKHYLKSITDNHADALAVCIYISSIEGYSIDWNSLFIEEGK